MTDHHPPPPSEPSPEHTEHAPPPLSLESISPSTSTWSLLEAVAPENQMPVRDSCWTKLTRTQPQPQQNNKRSEWAILEGDLGDVANAISRTASRLHGLDHEGREGPSMYARLAKEQRTRPRPRSDSGWITVADYSWGRWETSPLMPVNVCRSSVDADNEEQEKQATALKEEEDRQALEQRVHDGASDWYVIANYEYDSRKTAKKQVADQPSQQNGKAVSKKPNPFMRLMKVIEKMNLTGGDEDEVASTIPEVDQEQQEDSNKPNPQISEPVVRQQPLQEEFFYQESPQLVLLKQDQPISRRPSQTCREEEQQPRPCEPYRTLSNSASGREVF